MVDPIKTIQGEGQNILGILVAQYVPAYELHKLKKSFFLTYMPYGNMIIDNSAHRSNGCARTRPVFAGRLGKLKRNRV